MQKFPFVLSLLAISSTAFAVSNDLQCSSCGGYGSPFGPGYSYTCYFVKQGNQLVDAHRFNDEGEDCQAARAADPACAGSGNGIGITAPKGGDPCPRM